MKILRTSNRPRHGAGLFVGTSLVALSVVGTALAVGHPARWEALGPLALAGLLGAALLVRANLPLRQVVALALLLRIVSIAMPGLALSDDLYRYLWDGRVATSGVPPYAYRPDDSALASLRDSVVFPRLNSPSYYSVYPPVSQAVFRAAGEIEAVAGSAWGFRVLRGFGWIAEALALLLLARLAKASPVLMSVFALYALHPLVIVEAGQGHTELYALPLLAAALLARSSRRDGWAGAAMALAGWVKLVPLVLLPGWLRTSRRGWMAAGIVGLTGALWVGRDTPNVLASLRLYTSHFEFNAPFYLTLKKALGWWLGGDTGPLAAALLAVLFAAFVLVAWRKRVRLGTVWLAFLACSTTVHPWYLLPVLLLAVGEGDRQTVRAVAWLAACAMGTYTHYTTGGDAFWSWMGWLGALALVVPWSRLIEAVLRQRARVKVRHIMPLLPIKTQTLDLGAGEGFVGDELFRHGYKVTLADIADFRRSALPFVLLDPLQPLPFARGAFEVAVLVFVLHHARDPVFVLDEALRVAPRVVVLESVFETTADRRLLEVLDRLANRLRSPAMREQEPHLHFRTADAWADLARSLGATATVQRLGRWPHKQALLLLERNAEQ